MGPLAFLVAAPAFAQTAAGALASQREARALVDAALRAHGGDDAIAAAGPIVVRFTGRRTMIGQSQSFVPPYGTEPWPITTWFDLAGNRIVEEQDNHYPGGYLLRYRFVVTPDAAFSLNLNGSFEGSVVDRSPGQDLAGTRAWLSRGLPIPLLVHARERAASLRRVEGGAVLAEADGSVVTLRFDPSSHLLAGYETIGDHGLVGDNHVAVGWSGWKTQSGLVVPTVFRELRNGKPSREGTLAVSFAAPDEASFAVPPGFAEAPPEPPPVRPRSGDGRVSGRGPDRRGPAGAETVSEAREVAGSSRGAACGRMRL